MRSILTTWDDPATFETLHGSPKHWQQEMLKNIPSKLFRRYAWAINSTADLPRGTVFLKRKKQYQKGRTIISYAGSLCSKLLQLASIVITIITRTLYPDAPGLQSMPQLWRSLHRHWSKPSSEPDQEWNDDLVGFFNAVPRRDTIREVNVLTEQFLKQSGCTVLSVDLLSKSGHQVKPRGRTCSSFKRCWVGDLPLIRYPSPPGFLKLLVSVAYRKKAHVPATKFLPFYRDYLFSCGGTNIFEISSACDFLLVPVPAICGQPPDIGTVPYSAAFTDSTVLSP